jgi:hypothetical protein
MIYEPMVRVELQGFKTLAITALVGSSIEIV